MTSPPTGYAATRSAPGPVTGGTRAPATSFSVSTGGGSGIPPRPTPESLPASGNASSILPVPPGTIKPRISAAVLAAVVAIAAIGIAVVVGVYYAVSTPSKPTMTVTTGKAAPETPTNAPAAAQPAQLPSQSPSQLPVPEPAPLPAPAPAAAAVEPAPDPDDVAWENARVAGTKAAVDDYLNRFPTGRNVAAAKTEQARIVAATAPTTVRVNLAIKPWGNVSVNGVPQGASPPLKKLELKDGKYSIDISNGTQSYSQQIEVKLGQRAISIAHQFNN